MESLGIMLSSGLFLFGIVILRFTHVVFSNNSFFFSLIADYYIITAAYPDLFIHSLIEHWVVYSFGTVTNTAAMNTCAPVIVWTSVNTCGQNGWIISQQSASLFKKLPKARKCSSSGRALASHLKTLGSSAAPHTHSHMHTHEHTYTHTHSMFLSYTHMHGFSLSHTHTHSLFLSHTHTYRARMVLLSHVPSTVHGSIAELKLGCPNLKALTGTVTVQGD
jgi:hypothetical protein